MTTSEKAKELVEKFKDFAHGYNKKGYEGQLILNQKSCALICVDEIQKALEGHDDTAYDGYGYWEQVKKEINSL